MKFIATYYRPCFLFLVLAIPLYGSDQSTKFYDIISSYIFSFQKYFIRAQYPVKIPTNEIGVQLGTDLCDQENTFQQNRLKKVQETLLQYFGIEQPLQIAFCCSGGGNRAMIGALGLLSGAAKTKLLDATMYLAGASGSTWAIVPYFYQQACYHKDSQQALSDLYDYFSSSLSSGVRFCFDDYYTPALLNLDQSDDFSKQLIVRYGYNQNITLVDLFGSLIGNQSLGFLGDQKLHTTWSMLVQDALQGNAPLPLCAAAFKTPSLEYGYFEMSPFQSGNKNLGYIPTQYLGSLFTNKKLDINNICPEYPLAFYLGLYGSAFAAIVQDIYTQQQQKSMNANPLFCMFDQSNIQNNRNYKGWNLFNNYSITGKVEMAIESLLNQDNLDIYAELINYNPQAMDGYTTLGLFDAGIGCNFPISSLIDRPDRAVDLIIMYDSHPGSADVKTVYDYAISCGISIDVKMKELSIDDLAKSSMTIFNDPRSTDYNPLAVTILYFPTQNIDISCPPYTTYNFKYEINEIKQLKDSMESVLTSNIENITDIMKLIADKKTLKGE